LRKKIRRFPGGCLGPYFFLKDGFRKKRPPINNLWLFSDFFDRLFGGGRPGNGGSYKKKQ
jgi:hypothetical protein